MIGNGIGGRGGREERLLPWICCLAVGRSVGQPFRPVTGNIRYLRVRGGEYYGDGYGKTEWDGAIGRKQASKRTTEDVQMFRC